MKLLISQTWKNNKILNGVGEGAAVHYVYNGNLLENYYHLKTYIVTPRTPLTNSVI